MATSELSISSLSTLLFQESTVAEAQILIREVSGNQVYYLANRDGPVFEELASILRKASALVDVLANALAPRAEKIIVAVVFAVAPQINPRQH